jgi:hypothetical protein
MDKRFDASYIICSCQYSTGTYDYVFCYDKQQVKKEVKKMKSEEFTIMVVLELVKTKDLTKDYI